MSLFNQEIKTRKRSSSKTKSNYNPISSHEQQQQSLRSSNALHSFQQQVPSLDQLVWVLKLKSLNGTFDSKTLIIPETPETLKFGRPGGSKIQSKPTNGFFDSRVLSRNHAELFIDAIKGSLFIRDLKSSNGTYINGKQIEPFKNYELKIGDKFDLGSNLENQTAHKKISCEISDLLLMNYRKYNELLYQTDINDKDNEKELFNNVMDVLIYGDVINDMYEDNLLNLLGDDSVKSPAGTKKLENSFPISGLYPSSNIKNNSKLEDTISQLLIIINNETLQNEKLNKVNRFLNRFNENLDQVEQVFQIEAKLLETTVPKEEYNELQLKYNQSQAEIEKLNQEISKIKADFQLKETQIIGQTQRNDKLEENLILKNIQIEQLNAKVEELARDYETLSKEKEIIIEFKNAEIEKFEDSALEARQRAEDATDVDSSSAVDLETVEEMSFREMGQYLEQNPAQGTDSDYSSEALLKPNSKTNLKLDQLNNIKQQIISQKESDRSLNSLEQGAGPRLASETEELSNDIEVPVPQDSDEFNEEKSKTSVNTGDAVPATTATTATTAATASPPLRSNLFHATLVLLASLVIGATVYQAK